MNKRFWHMAALPLLGLVGCAGTGSVDRDPPPVLNRADGALIKRTGVLLYKGDPAWRKSYAELALKTDRRREFARILVGLLVKRAAGVGRSPELFGRGLAKDPECRLLMEGLRASEEHAVTPLMRAIRSGDTLARGVGAEVAGRLGEGVERALVTALRLGEPPHVAASCARALGYRQGSAVALDALVAAAGGGDYRVRGAALTALGRHGGSRSTAILVATLRDRSDPFLQRMALGGLVHLGDKGQVPLIIDYLEAGLEARDAPGIKAAIAALEKLTGRRFRIRVDLWRNWWAQQARDGEGRG